MRGDAFVVQAVGARAAVDHDVALVEVERRLRRSRLLRLANEGHQGVHLGGIPEAVVHHLGDFGRRAGRGGASGRGRASVARCTRWAA